MRRRRPHRIPRRAIHGLDLRRRHPIGAGGDGAGQVRELSNGQPALKLEGVSLSEPLSLSTGFADKLYQQLTLSGYPTAAPAARGNNLSIERGFYGLDGRPLDLGNLASGQLVLVHLAVRAEELVAMVAAIALTLRKRKDTKTVEATMQLRARAQDRVELVKMAATRKAEPVMAAEAEEKKA